MPIFDVGHRFWRSHPQKRLNRSIDTIVQTDVATVLPINALFARDGLKKGLNECSCHFAKRDNNILKAHLT